MSIIINGIVWDIYFVPRYSDYLIMNNGEYTIGVTDLRTKAIYIADDIDGWLLEDVIQHEICHAIMFSQGYDFNIPEEECICSIMGHYADDVTYLTNSIYNQLGL